VAQVVEANRRQLGLTQERSELAGRDMPAPQRLAEVVAKDEVVVGGAVADGQQPLCLARAMGPQQVDGRVGECDRALALGGPDAVLLVQLSEDVSVLDERYSQYE
jgi:hypothetical protein